MPYLIAVILVHFLFVLVAIDDSGLPWNWSSEAFNYILGFYFMLAIPSMLGVCILIAVKRFVAGSAEDKSEDGIPKA